jgi:hypothetical protein
MKSHLVRNPQLNMATIILEPTDIRFVRRLAREINRECASDGFYSSFGVPAEAAFGSRKFFGSVRVRRGRLLAREVGGSGKWDVDLTGADSVEGNGIGTVTASRRFVE